MTTSNLKGTLELVLRQCVFFILSIYALSKLLGGQFYMKGKLPTEIANTTLGEASGFSLAWTFMGYSYVYILFIGVLQLIGAWFLLWNKTKLIGVLILIPIMVNILLFDLIFLDVYPALSNAIIILIMLFFILFFNKERVTDVIQRLTHFEPTPKMLWKRRLITLGLTLLLIILIFTVDSFVEYWFGASKEKIIS
ncbi:MAG: hypothetical protein ACI828_000439 [Flavobacteriales bacterium]|jgi:hypothetical protein